MKTFVLMVALAVGSIVCLSSASLAVAPEPGTTAKVSAYVGPSVVLVETTYKARVFDASTPGYVLDEKGRAKVFTVTVSCTGFIVNPDGYVATAGHCVDPKAIDHRVEEAAVSWYIRFGAEGTPSQVLTQADFDIMPADPDSRRQDADRGAIRVAWGSENSQQRKAQLINFRTASAGDSALLKIGGSDLSAVKLVTGRDLGIGTGVVSAGYASTVDAADDEFQPSYKSGQIKSKNTIDGGLLSVFGVSAPLSRDMSGGPATTLNGDVIGFNSFMAVQGAKGSEPYRFIGTSERILESLSAAGVKNELGPTSNRYVAGLDAYFAGDKERAVESLQAVVDAQPKHPTAQLYLERAKSLPGPDTFPIALVLGLVIAMVAVIGAIVLLVRLTRGRHPDVRDDVVVRRLTSLIETPVSDPAAGNSSDRDQLSASPQSESSTLVEDRPAGNS